MRPRRRGSHRGFARRARNVEEASEGSIVPRAQRSNLRRGLTLQDGNDATTDVRFRCVPGTEEPTKHSIVPPRERKRPSEVPKSSPLDRRTVRRFRGAHRSTERPSEGSSELIARPSHVRGFPGARRAAKKNGPRVPEDRRQKDCTDTSV
ncbi:hypothetical protein DB32_003485 [Sandaracinus amylolyticus]|uniref:Uncharacterized protein n=1 Tax=Sandaracinus amylolyticus TaxID=927083 RepID=A0A0F6W3A9_9BACT|nr:hypothetical protein DB32_003485 [Sandaracinus amylolyticus]